MENYITDFTFWAEKTGYPGCTACRVHKGFYEGYVYGLAPQLRRPLRALVQAYPEYTFTVMGHSLGAALAVHFVLDAVANFTYPQHISFYTMGEPSVGNAAFMEHLEMQTTLGQRWRIVNQHDIVPHLPPRNWLLNYSQWGHAHEPSINLTLMLTTIPCEGRRCGTSTQKTPCPRFVKVGPIRRAQRHCHFMIGHR